MADLVTHAANTSDFLSLNYLPSSGADRQVVEVDQRFDDEVCVMIPFGYWYSN